MAAGLAALPADASGLCCCPRAPRHAPPLVGTCCAQPRLRAFSGAAVLACRPCMLAAGTFLLPGWKRHSLLVQTVFPGPFMFRFLTRRGPEKASFYPHVLEGLLGEVGFTSLSKELAWHLRRDLWPRDPETVRDARGGKDGGPGCRLGLAGAGGGGLTWPWTVTANLQCAGDCPHALTSRRTAVPSLGRTESLVPGAGCPGHNLCPGWRSHYRKSRGACGDGQERPRASLGS